MSEEIREHCGLVVTHNLHDAYRMIQDLQHRGRDAVGIAAIGDRGIDVLKWVKTVSNFDRGDLHKIFPAEKYHTFLAHLRYATRGKDLDVLDYAHPHTVGGKIEKRGDHIFIFGCDIAVVHNGQIDDSSLPILDNSPFVTDCDTERLLRFYQENGEEGILRKIPGAYTVAIADRLKKGVIVLRDHTGIRPGVLGKKNGKFIVASEDIALRKNGADAVEDLDPGTIYRLFPNGDYEKKEIVPPDFAFCFFEHNYQADQESIVNRVSVRVLRTALGERLALEYNNLKADYVTYVPRCPETAARGFAKVTKIPVIDVFYKKNAERSFQGPDSNERRKSIVSNLHLLPGVKEKIRGKRVIVIEDSTVRGNAVARVRELLHAEAEVGEAHLLNYTPPIGIIGADNEPRGCLFGIDMPPLPPSGEEYIARGRSVEEISKKVGMSVKYLSLEGLLSTFEQCGINRDHLCTFCIGGEKPF